MDVEFSGSVQPAERGENLGIHVGGGVQLMAGDAPPNRAPEIVVQQEVDKCAGVDHRLSHDA